MLERMQRNKYKMSYQIFLSSCFDQEMQKNREVFRADLIARFNERSGRYGENTFITDCWDMMKKTEPLAKEAQT